MLIRKIPIFIALFGVAFAPAVRAQAPPAASTPPATSTPASTPASAPPLVVPAHRVGGFVPGQHRAPEDPAKIARGKTIYGINCAICHGTDLRGGDMGGPNLLRSQVALTDQHGEEILPIIQGARQNAGMPAIPISPEDGLAVVAFIHSVLETIGVQGTPPSAGKVATDILVGNAKEGQAYFAVKCATCHSVTGDLKGLAARISDPKDIQNAFLRGEGRQGHRTVEDPDAAKRRTVTATVTLPSGENVEGKLLHVDDFLVTIQFPDTSSRSFVRRGDQPKVEIHDPLKPHRDMLRVYTDRDVHDLTAYLVTLK